MVAVVESALDLLKEAGVKLIELDLPDINGAIAATRTTFAEANAIHEANFADFPDHFGLDVRKKMEDGQSVTTADYARVQRFRLPFRRQVESLFKDCDVIAMPTATIAAAPIDRRPEDHPTLSWRNCGVFNFTGHPAVSLPCGFVQSGLPVGTMLVGPILGDEGLLQHAALVEAVFGFKGDPRGFE